MSPMSATSRSTPNLQSKKLVTQDLRRLRLVVTKINLHCEDQMMALKWIAYRTVFLVRAIASMKWEPVPFFGVGLLAVWALWITIAISH
jgi:hypothetical protein